jgi:hypothetical protein
MPTLAEGLIIILLVGISWQIASGISGRVDSLQRSLDSIDSNLTAIFKEIRKH